MIETKLLLILGIQRSGTTLLASMLGRHSEINMLFESVTDDVNFLIGKKYKGNKLLCWRQIRQSQRSSKIGHLLNRLANFDFKRKNRHHKRRPYPTSRMSVDDYLNNDALIIGIHRAKQDVVNSIVSRTEMTDQQAKDEYELGMKIISDLGKRLHLVEFDDLVTNPELVMRLICNFLDLNYEESMLDGPKFNIVYPNSRIMTDKASAT